MSLNRRIWGLKESGSLAAVPLTSPVSLVGGFSKRQYASRAYYFITHML